GWRASAETPVEHAARTVARDARWEAALPVVDAFAAVRYAERQPSPDELGRASDAIERLEAIPDPARR
ncbi:MAG: DUF4129 domain-containing protein, partial [Chloroflexi bacterium]|nr:DUF4129 domain-containing protein [Chloroflexota bacterium]